MDFGVFLRLRISCVEPARTGVQAELSEFIVRAWTPAAAGCMENSADEGKLIPYAAAIQVTGAGARYPNELCGRTVL
jgi:hypothetical protein